MNYLIGEYLLIGQTKIIKNVKVLSMALLLHAARPMLPSPCFKPRSPWFYIRSSNFKQTTQHSFTGSVLSIKVLLLKNLNKISHETGKRRILENQERKTP